MRFHHGWELELDFTGLIERETDIYSILHSTVENRTLESCRRCGF
jgi:hypothetical protein